MEQVRKRGLPPLFLVRVILRQRGRYCDYMLAVYFSGAHLFTAVVVLAFESNSAQSTWSESTSSVAVTRSS